MAKHISQKFSFKGVLSRNSTYRDDCRPKLSGIGTYDNVANILAGIQKRDLAQGNGPLVKGLTQAQRVPTYTFNHFQIKAQKLNFCTGYLPYHNEAHHVVPVEVFYDKKWTTPHLHVVLATKYNINFQDNIIILPQCEGELHLMDYHVLPDHSRSHNKYNDRVVSECDDVFDLVDQALAEKDCTKKKDLRQQVYDKLKQIETNNFNHLKNLGASPMS